ncbi:hypothetical protein LIER_31166 [Lithospermum erythrorhizon]|uniref:Uncharacterized protein n=1 Tax=Lithospermum erythrorhizon TaxID=34254 RepID=A0AAV3RR41_LITER
MRVMAKLKSGVLLKLLEDMNQNNNSLEMFDKKPVIIQIRGIIPVLEEGDLWPNKGFYLRVSDLSHAIFVSLPPNHDEMILSNNLKLGQYIYVQRLEKSEPVPLLRGITPVPGIRNCEGSPEDIVSTPKFLKQIKFPEHDSIVEKSVISEEVIKNSANRRMLASGGRPHRKIRSTSASKVRPSEPRKSFDTRSRGSSVDHDSDSDSTLSCVSSSRVSKRRSWNESEILRVKQIVNSSMVKQERTPRPRSANASPVRRARYDSSDDNSSCLTNRKVKGAPRKLVKSTKTSKISVAKVNAEPISSPTCCLVGEKKGAETGILWGSLPPNLIKLGKEIIKQRDTALLAAAEALQEACAAERLLNCLSTFSDFHLSEGDELQPTVDKFFDLQENLAQSRLITQSLKNISPLRDSETDSGGSSSIKDTLKIAVERKKNAITWIKSAMAVDLSPCSNSNNPINCSSEGTLQAVKTSAMPLQGTKPKGPCIIKLHRQSEDISSISTSDKDEQSEWTRGCTLASSTDMATSLQNECRNLFLGYVEKYLDEVDRKSSLGGSDSEIAGILINIKKVNDWLDNIVNKEVARNSCNDGCEESANSDDPGLEACKRVRNKIYDILMKHVERTAMALENTSS